MKSTAPIVALVMTACMGCSGLSKVLRFKDQVEQTQQASRIEGSVSTEVPTQGPLIIVLASPGAEQSDPLIGVDTYTRTQPGSFAFVVAPGRYLVGAYEDRNRNGLLDPGEPAVSVRSNPLLEVGPGEEVSRDIFIAKGSTIPELKEPINLFELVARTPQEQRHFSLWAWSNQGEVCDDPRSDAFGAEAGQLGLWRMMDFLNEGLTGVYFLEPYDADRIPVLFVHGLSGHPNELSDLMEGIDRSRFQPWFYFYPSGFKLDGISSHLAVLLERLQVERGFDEIAFITHSMGGLVSRGALFKLEEATGQNPVRLFISLSAPWGGDKRGLTAEKAPIQVPLSFKDLSPTSDYVRWLYYQDEDATIPRSLPEDTDYHLLFSFRMKKSGTFSNDGAISVSSQLRAEAQREATTQRGYDLTHTEILGAPDVQEDVNALLDQHFR